MEIPVSRWFPMVAQRHSRRQFEAAKPVSPQTISGLQKTCREFRPFSSSRVELVTTSPDRVFKGILGSYGKISGATAFLAMIGDTASPNFQEAAGYTGEGLLLEAASLGLGTCWVSGSFHPLVAGELAKTRANEKVLAVCPLGYPSPSSPFSEKLLSGFGRSHTRKAISEFISGFPEHDWPEWTRAALEAARLAPSAYNRQPWQFQVEKDAIIVSTNEKITDRGTSKRLECGIAMLHLELGALQTGKRGKWEMLSAPQVARFKV